MSTRRRVLAWAFLLVMVAFLLSCAAAESWSQVIGALSGAFLAGVGARAVTIPPPG